MLNIDEKIHEIREKTAAVLNDLIISQKLALQALESCDEKGFEQVNIPLKSINETVDEIDNLILTAFVRILPRQEIFANWLHF